MQGGGITREIEIDGIKVKFRASAALLRNYRLKFNKDLLSELNKLHEGIQYDKDNPDNVVGFDIEALITFENIAYMMASMADKDILSEEEWFDQFAVFSIYKVLPEIIELWKLNMKQESESKKKLEKLAGK